MGRGDMILCQITSNAYSDPLALKINGADFESGSLSRISYIRPGKIFTANTSLVSGYIGNLNQQTFTAVRKAITDIVNGSPAI